MSTEVLNISPVVVWVIALSQLLTFALTVWNLMASGSRANAKRIEALEGRADRLTSRVDRFDQALATMPAKDDMYGLQISMSEMRGDLREMQATMRGNTEIMRRLEDIVSRHENHLLDGAKR